MHTRELILHMATNASIKFNMKVWFGHKDTFKLQAYHTKVDTARPMCVCILIQSCSFKILFGVNVWKHFKLARLHIMHTINVCLTGAFSMGI